MSKDIEEIMPGIFRAALPLPKNPLKAVNSYIIPDTEKTLVIDVGFNLPECAAALSSALNELGRPWESVQVLATHSHTDHIGLLDSLPNTDYPVLAGFSAFDDIRSHYEEEKKASYPIEIQIIRDLASGVLTESTKSLAQIEASELKTNVSGKMPCNTFKAEFSKEFLVPKSSPTIQKLSEGDIVTAGKYNFEVKETPGHDNWHICLHDRTSNLIVVGDHVLRRITPTVNTWHPQNDVLFAYLASLKRMPDDNDLVALPAHGKPISKLSAETGRIIAHHAARLEEFFELVRDGYDNVATITANASWRYDNWYKWNTNQQLFSMGEALAHLFRLANEGRIKVLPSSRYLYRFVPC